ncbi:ABC transporter substrate-binding protein [Candidatus Epulonipiscium fishelsonii]|uniref:ABC transporter substrate-binding protein n=1 Tax=Candidatus Epulonipiscium fishelsonii TaxID=77094 RepID=A0ACC8XCK8_9FIRM|nr:ABC transporter substrate-binding protein [Epulopiscium sp. SCG-B11WGA-EpuloA1]ONI40762.1 ABC transporter substrate-binding protein [Epulopiscium sp. SCG-B05WGA-EpuloA1]
MSKKFVSMVALLTTSSIILTACGGNSTTEVPTVEPTVVENSVSEPPTENVVTTVEEVVVTIEEEVIMPIEEELEEVAPIEEIIEVAEVKFSPEGYPMADVQEMVYNLGVEPLTLDPQLSSAIDSAQIINNTFEGLVREVDGKITPGMAESWEISDNQLVYTFYLRDAKWSDGKPVTAHDFVYAWQRGVDPMTASQYGHVFESASVLNAGPISRGEDIIDPATGETRPSTKEDLGIRAIDDKTLEIRLTNPTEYFLSLIMSSTFMPVREDVVDADGIWAKDPEKFVSNGPFVLTDYSIGDEIVLEKNPNYWNAENVYLEKLICKMIVDASTAYTGYKTGEIDFLQTIPSSEIPMLLAENPEFYVLPYIGSYYFVLNLNNEVLQDLDVRKALNYAIDREAIVEIAGAGQIPATGFVGPGFLDTEGNEFYKVAGNYGISLTGDAEKAQKALADAGYPNGEGFPEIEIMYNTNEGHKLICEAIQEMLTTNLGIDVTLTNQEWAVFQETRNHHEYDWIARHGWIGDYTDPNTMLENFITGNAQNNSAYSSPVYDEHMALSKVTTGKERMDHLYAAHDALMTDLPFIPIYYYVNTVLAVDEVEGWELAPQGEIWFGDVVMLDFDKMAE